MITFFLMIVTSWLFDLPGQRPHGRSSTTRRGARHHLKVVVIINGVFVMKVVATIKEVSSINKLLHEFDDIFELSAPRHQWSTRTCCRELSSAWTARNLAPEQEQWSRWNILEYSEQAQQSRWNVQEYSEQAQQSGWNIPINVDILEGTDPSSIAGVEDRPWHFRCKFVISPQHLPGGCRCPRSGQLHLDNWWITKDVKESRFLIEGVNYYFANFVCNGNRPNQKLLVYQHFSTFSFVVLLPWTHGSAAVLSPPLLMSTNHFQFRINWSRK